MRIGARIERLERSAGVGAQTCGTCGHPTDGRRLPPGSYAVTVYGGSEDRPPYEGPERCPDCGAQLLVKIEFEKGG